MTTSTIVDYVEPPQWALAIACIAAAQTLSVDVVRITHDVRSVQVTCMGQVVAAKLVTGPERKPAIDMMFRWREILGCEMEELGIMIYERHDIYEIMEWSEFGECGVWMHPGAMDEVDPVIVLPTVEAARIWVQKKLAPAPAVASAAADVSTWALPSEMVTPEVKAVLERLQAELDSAKAERGQRRLRILHLRRALKEIETTSGDNNSVLDAKEALEQDYTLASKEALQASAPPADGESEGGE